MPWACGDINMGWLEEKRSGFRKLKELLVVISVQHADISQQRVLPHFANEGPGATYTLAASPGPLLRG